MAGKLKCCLQYFPFCRGLIAQLDDPDRIVELMQRYAEGIESHVRQHPDHLSRI